MQPRLIFSFQQEMAETLADCLLRRTMVGLNSSRWNWGGRKGSCNREEISGLELKREFEEEVAAYRTLCEEISTTFDGAGNRR